MKIGIYTQYSHSEPTYAALRIADWASSRGLDAAIMTSTSRPPELHRAWDRRLLMRQQTSPKDWLESCDAVIWTGIPPEHEAAYIRGEGVKTVGLAMWRELKDGHRQIYKNLDAVVAPSQAAAVAIQNAWDLSNVHAVPWDAGWPPVVKHPSRLRSDHVRVLLPLVDDMPDRTEWSVLRVLEQLLDRDNVHATVSFLPSMLRPACIRELEHIAETCGRLTLDRSRPYMDRPFLFASHDVTLWPSQVEDIGLIGLHSIAAGTPVIAFDIPPINEFINDQNGWAVPCDLSPSPLCVAAAPDYVAMAEALAEAVDDHDGRTARESSTVDGLVRRAVLFEDGWDRVLGVGS